MSKYAWPTISKVRRLYYFLMTNSVITQTVKRDPWYDESNQTWLLSSHVTVLAFVCFCYQLAYLSTNWVDLKTVISCSDYSEFISESCHLSDGTVNVTTLAKFISISQVRVFRFLITNRRYEIIFSGFPSSKFPNYERRSIRQRIVNLLVNVGLE